MAPKTSNTTTPSKATNSPSSKATTPANSRPSTPVKTQTQSSDILANASEAVYQQALSASDTAAKTNLEKVINTSFPKARIIMGMDENSGQRFVRVYAAESYNVLAFMYASDIKGALTAVKTQLECVAKLKSGQNIPDAQANADPYLNLYSKMMKKDKTATLAWSLEVDEDENILHKFTIHIKKSKTPVTVIGGPGGLSNATAQAVTGLN